MGDAIHTAMRVFSTWRTSGELQLDALRDALTLAPEPASLTALEAGPSDQRIFVVSLVSALVESGLEAWDDDEALRLGIDWLRRDLHALDLGGLLRLARLATALDDRAASDEAMLRAIAIDPLVLWWSDLDVDAERIDEVETRELAYAIARRRVTGRWSPVGSSSDGASAVASGAAAELIHAAEQLRAALRGDVVDLEALGAELDALTHPHAPVFGVVGALARGDDTQAADRLRALLGDLAADDAVAGVIAALRTELFRPPHELESVLRRMYFEAVVDPFGSLEVPASAFASFRRLLAGVMLAAVLSGPGVAQADVPEETTTTQSSESNGQDASTEARDDEAEEDVDADLGAPGEDERGGEPDEPTEASRPPSRGKTPRSSRRGKTPRR